jgi:hypothetical protein
MHPAGQDGTWSKSRKNEWVRIQDVMPTATTQHSSSTIFVPFGTIVRNADEARDALRAGWASGRPAAKACRRIK